MIFRTPYSEIARETLSDFSASLAKQCFKDECDVNRILNKDAKTGLISLVNRCL
ncbi:hypothetical protein, partial [Nocardia mangyaensis]|uniref:hypothetical protein n=1 Tax=Nocardia mangyaensis TaxID=2213200 RepID=UPI003F585867